MNLKNYRHKTDIHNLCIKKVNYAYTFNIRKSIRGIYHGD